VRSINTKQLGSSQARELNAVRFQLSDRTHLHRPPVDSIAVNSRAQGDESQLTKWISQLDEAYTNLTTGPGRDTR